MRKELGRWADAIGARRTLALGRDHLVDLLNGDRGSPSVRRNRIDDRNLKILLRFMLRSDSNCLDAGASRGKFLRLFQQVAPLGTHIAYEPVPSLCQALVREFPTMEIRQCALSDQDGKSTFVHVLDPGFRGYSRLEEYLGEESYPSDLHTEAIVVRTERLDDHLPAGWLPDFIKIDVEGAESLVLSGAIDTLRRARPIVAFEHELHIGISEEIHRLLSSDVGLRIFDLDGNGPLDRSQFLDRLRSRSNWVAFE